MSVLDPEAPIKEEEVVVTPEEEVITKSSETDTNKEVEVEEVTENSEAELEAMLSMSDDDFLKKAEEFEEKRLVDPDAQIELETAPAKEETKEEKEVTTKEKVTTPSLINPLEASDTDAVDAYKKVFAPFQANGKTVQAKTPEEAIKLMQMGAGYTKAMTDLKPARVMVKTLENNGIGTDELNYLIALKDGDPDAIKKLVRDAKIDPFDIETGDDQVAADKNYKPKNYAVSETQVDFESVVADLSSLPHGSEILESVKTDWDESSRAMAYNDPTILQELTNQKQSGIYDQIMTQVDHERMLGKLNGVPVISAYQMVGEAMSNQGLLTVTTQTGQGTNTQEPVTPQVIDRKADTPKSKVSNDAAAKAAAGVRTGNGPAKKTTINPLSISDEEFEKLDGLGSFA